MADIRILSFKCYKVAARLPLDRIASFFNTQRELSWKDYLILKDEHLGIVLKYEVFDKHVYLFSFGCITFLNFNDYEVQTFLRYVESIAGKVDYYLFSAFRETHSIEVDEQGSAALVKGSEGLPLYEGERGYYSDTIHIVSMILAKSTELHKIESDIGYLLDRAEQFVVYLQKGKLRRKTKKAAKIVAKILRFEYESIGGIRILDRLIEDEHSVQLRRAYDEMEKYYELHDRFDIIEGKIKDLRDITKAYSLFTFKHNETRLYWFEIFLLALFPLAYVIGYLTENYNIMGIIRQILR